MNKRFLFVNLSIESGYSGVQHGVAFLSPILKRHSYSAACLNIRSKISGEEFLKKVISHNPSMVGFSSTTHQLKYLLMYSKALEKHPEILQIAGGAGVTLDPEFILSKANVSGACIGEGEIPLDNLLTNIENGRDISGTNGMWWRTNDGIKKNPAAGYITDLSSLDFPDYSIFERDIVVCGGHLYVLLSRGCPYNCYYCCNKALAGIYGALSGEYFRAPSVDYCVKFLKHMLGKYNEIKYIEFEDDLLIANKAWFGEFAREYRKEIGLPYRVCVRIECIDHDLVESMKSSGCKKVCIGLESGNEQLRHRILNRKYSNTLFIEKAKIIKDAGIDLYTFNIVGFPFEGKKEMKDTLELNKVIGSDKGVCTFFFPYKNTELYNICRQNNLLKSEDELLDMTNYNTRPAIKMTPEQERDCVYFQREISLYLWNQEMLAVTSKMPAGAQKIFTIIYYWAGAVIWKMPLLYKTACRLYTVPFIRSIVQGLRR